MRQTESISPPLFITGTDTEIGKTWATLALIKYLRTQGVCVAGMKPVASGSELTAEGLRNEDALLIQQQAGLQTAYVQVNPYAFGRTHCTAYCCPENGYRD